MHFLLLPHIGVSPEEKNKRTVKPKPITLPVDAKPPKERKCIPHSFSTAIFILTFYSLWQSLFDFIMCIFRIAVATATPVNTSLGQGSTDSTPSGRPAYPRTQYTISRAHVTIDQNAMVNSQTPESTYASHTSHCGYEPGAYAW